jgi:hypothetical protein
MELVTGKVTSCDGQDFSESWVGWSSPYRSRSLNSRTKTYREMGEASIATPAFSNCSEEGRVCQSCTSEEQQFLQHNLSILVGARWDLFRLVTQRDKFHIANNFHPGVEFYFAFNG